MISVAHPKFRDDLLRVARERKIVHPQQISLPQSLQPYPLKYEISHKFGHNLEVFFRPVRPNDEALLRELFYSHGPETILQRYMTPLKRLPHEQVQKFVTVDYSKDMAIVGVIPFEGREKMIAVARYFRDSATNEAEVAVTIHDQYQRQGIGSFLLRYLTKVALDYGITTFTADVLASNAGMIRLFEKLFRTIEIEHDNGVNRMKLNLHPADGTIETSPVSQIVERAE